MYTVNCIQYLNSFCIVIYCIYGLEFYIGNLEAVRNIATIIDSLLNILSESGKGQ